MKTQSSDGDLVDLTLWIWFAITALCVARVTYLQFKAKQAQEECSPERTAMKWGWVLVTLYTGPLGFIAHRWHRKATRGTPGERRAPPLRAQAVESTIHCVAGDATGVLLAAVVTTWLRLPLSVEVIVEYVAGFAVGVLVFQALAMRSTFGGDYWRAVRGTLLPEGLSMNAVMAGMVPVMVIFMSRDMSAMDPTSVRFWGTMSLATVVGTLATYPVNWWLVKRGLKHGMGGEERARLRCSVSASSKLAAMALTLAMLAGGGLLAALSFAPASLKL